MTMWTRDVFRTLVIPLLLWLSMCASSPAERDSSGTETHEQVILKHNTEEKKDRYAIYMVNMGNYTTKGGEYHQKYQPYLVGIAGEIIEKYKMTIVPGTVGFYYDKKSNDRSRLFLGLDINTNITLHLVQSDGSGRVGAAVLDLKYEGDARDDARIATDLLRSFIRQNLPFDVMDPHAVKEKLVSSARDVDNIDSLQAAVDAGRLLGVEKMIYGKMIARGSRLSLKVFSLDVAAEEEDVLEVELPKGDAMESPLRDFVKSFPVDRYNPMSEFDNRVPEYGETALYLLNRHLRDIMDTLGACGPVFSESEIVGVVIGFKWVRQGRREYCNIWISTADLVRFLDKRLAFPELVQRSTVTNTEGSVIRLPL